MTLIAEMKVDSPRRATTYGIKPPYAYVLPVFAHRKHVHELRRATFSDVLAVLLVTQGSVQQQ